MAIPSAPGHPPSCGHSPHSHVIPGVSQQLRALAPRHHAAIRLKLDGASGGAIAERLGVETRTVYLWMGDPLVKQELARQLERIGDEFARQLALAGVVGISQLTEAVQLPLEGPITAEQKLAFIREALDRFERLSGHARAKQRPPT